MKLSLNIPINYHKHFIDLIDFQVVDLDLYDQYPEVYSGLSKETEVWLNNCTFPLLKKHVKHFINPKRKVSICSIKSTSPASSFKETTKALHQLEIWQDHPLVGVWDDEAYEIKSLEQLFDMIAIPWTRPRRTYSSRRDLKKTAYFGFSNLSELEDLPPAYLHTSVPIMAAYHNIDLRERIRRPKHIEFEPFITLSKDEIELAQTNILAIKEAASESYQDEFRQSSTSPA